MILRIAVLVAVLLPAGWARADIYGFVDENGVAHLASSPVDQRYYLFKKEPRPVPSPADSPDAATGGAVRVNPEDRRRYSPLITAVAREERLEPALLHAVITVESGYNPKARSPKGAAGLMQLMPETAQRYEVANIWDPRENLRGGARYLRDLLAMFKDDLSLALAAYNAGERTVAQYGNRIPPFPETRSYVPRVLQQYQRLSGALVGRRMGDP
jgi:soluble lytic murein transglycosylase-like protein